MNNHSRIFFAHKRNHLQKRSKINMYNSLHYLHDNRNNFNKICRSFQYYRQCLYWRWQRVTEKNLTVSLSLPLLTHIWTFYLLTRYLRIICEICPRNCCCWCIVVFCEWIKEWYSDFSVAAGYIRGEHSLCIGIHWGCEYLKEWIIQILEQKNVWIHWLM